MNIRKIIGWFTYICSLLIICFWTYWGINEAFHEGWYSTSLWENLKLTFVQYLSIPIILIVLSFIAIYYKKVGLILFISLGIFTLFFFDSNAGRIMIFIPMFIFALGFYFGKFTHKKTFIFTIILLPLYIILAFGFPQLIRVKNRFNDSNYGLRIVTGNDVELTWAPQGAGFPLNGTGWTTANNNCARLSEDGLNLENDPVNIWRLPTRDEVVRSLTKDNKNAKGYLDSSGKARYEIAPDKETPLWNPHSRVIYYWTSESKDEKAYLVSYNGIILTRNITSGANYLGYRCVKATPQSSTTTY